MTGKIPNGNNPNQPMRSIDRIYPKKSHLQKAGALVTGATTEQQSAEERRAKQVARIERDRDSRITERKRIYQEAIESLATKHRDDYIGREHFLAIYLVVKPEDPEKPKDYTKPASEAFNTITRAQYPKYQASARVVKHEEAGEPKGPLKIDIARRDEVGLDVLDPVLNAVPSSIESLHAIRIGDFLNFVDAYRDLEKPLPDASRMGPKVRRVITMIGGFVEQRIAGEA